ncbi:fasciclin-2-like [Mya arenaria]|uniref:fasciclin-2-like n=1 Tax=Mya arenaria TaxID=6604 RepID=UPI0022E663FA|nr:fasciclin-2-like [Mya arenaria]
MVIFHLIVNIVIILVHGINSGAEAQVVTLSPTSPAVSEYSPLTFTCETQSTKTEHVIWSKLGEFHSNFAIGTIVINGDNDCSPPFPSLAPNSTLYSYACPATNRLTLTLKNVTRTENGNTWKCQVEVDGKTEHSEIATITVQVGITGVTLYPATDPLNVIENTETILQCRTSGGLPAASVKWFIQRTGHVQNFTLHSTNTYQEEDNLNVTLSTLNFTPLKSDHSGQIFCSANNVGMEKNSAKLSITVLYGPKSGTLQNVRKVRGETFVYQCLYTPGNPPTVDFEWMRSGTNVSWIKQKTHNLTIPNVQRSDEANYTCKVSSVLQPTLSSVTIIQHDTATFHLDVLYGAENLILHLNNVSHESVEIEEHSSNHFRCLLESDPGAEMSLTKDSRTIIAIPGVHQLTHELQAECSDTGVYTCSGYNQYGTADNMSVHLFVKCSARRPSGVEVQLNFTARQYGNATLVYKVVAYPVPKHSQFVWKRCSNGSSCDLLPDDINKFEINTEGLTSTLTILDVQIEDYRLYQLSVSNGVGDTLVEWLHLRPIDHTESSSSAGPVVGGAIGGTFGALVAIVVVVVILRRKRALKCMDSSAEKIDDSAGQSVSVKENPGHNAAKADADVPTDTSVYDALKAGDNGPDNSHVYMPLDVSITKAQVYNENVEKDDPVYNNTVLQNPVQTML